MRDFVRVIPVTLLLEIEDLVEGLEDRGLEEVSAFAGTEIVEEFL